MSGAVRIGFVLPAGNTTVEAEIPPRMQDAGTAHFHRFSRLVKSDSDVDECARAVVDAATVLRAARLDAIALAYTAGSFYGGCGLDERLIREMGDGSGTKATTAADAIVSALRSLGVAQLAVVSPYSKEINDRCERYLGASGFHVLSMVGSPPPGPAGDVPAEDIEQMATAAARSGPDALLISCTALRTMSLIEKLEGSLGIPVVSSNSATLWAAIRLAGGSLQGPRIGALFTRAGAGSSLS